MGEHAHPEVPHDALAQKAREEGLAVRAAELQDERQDIQPDGDADQMPIMVRHSNVYDALGQHGADQLERAFAAQEDDSWDDQVPIRLGVRQQAPHQPPIVGLAERILLVNACSCLPCHR